MRSYLVERYHRVILNNSSNEVYSEWEQTKHGVWQGSILRPLFFLLYINNLPELTSDISKLILFADDNSIIVSDADPMKFKLSINKTNVWFQSILLSLNYDKTYFLHFLRKNSHTLGILVSYVNTQITRGLSITFLGLIIDRSLPWKNHIDSLIPKLNNSCFAIRLIKLFSSPEILRMFYFSYFDSIITYGIIFWGILPIPIIYSKFKKKDN
jgi:hypothetical protein